MEQVQYDTLEIYGYKGYPLATRQELEHISSSIQARIVNIRDSLMEIGEMLTKARGLVKHGEWGAWLQSNFQWSESTARNYMNVVSTFGKSATVADLKNINTAALYMLASPQVPDDARGQAIEETRTGGAVTKARAKEIIEEHKQPAAGVVWAEPAAMAEPPVVPSASYELCSVCQKRQVIVHVGNGIKGIWYGRFDESGQVVCETCSKQAAAEPTPVVAAAAEPVEELPPEIIAHKIKFIGYELVKQAVKMITEIKGQSYQEWAKYDPPADELQAVAEELFSVLYDDIEQGVTFVQEGNNE